MAIPVIDLFAGPGGLSEGFSQNGETRGSARFQIAASIEVESNACNTLILRGAYRHLFRTGQSLKSYYAFLRSEKSLEELFRDEKFAKAIEVARGHVHKIELGPKNREEAREVIQRALGKRNKAKHFPWVLIGGPPCQAYSLAGRSRRANDETFEDDHKHFLYREYLDIIAAFAPPIFVMENVKGLLSSTHGGKAMFERIIRDLSQPKKGLNYEVHSLAVREVDEYRPSDFVIRAEEHGVPQRRHRVLLLGIRSDIAPPKELIPSLGVRSENTVFDAIGKLPELRSGISTGDSLQEWLTLREKAASRFPRSISGRRRKTRLSRGGDFVECDLGPAKTELETFLNDPQIGGVTQHETRSHMAQDLIRYWYAATTAESDGVSPTLRDFPKSLLPSHSNVKSLTRPFEDRFRVQVATKPSTTIVSHIAKDGHYYIHPDPLQMRSLTVREAARLQTFPDNYFFTGNRTNQYHQVGNAVPPLLARDVAEIVFRLLEN